MENNKLTSRCLRACLFICALVTSVAGLAQENKSLPDKVHHAEPLYNDLVRDLGARKGEKDRQTILSVLRSIRKFLPMR
ncbi:MULTISPECIES: hypothetical protein [Sphingobacterium]|uniref:hypothetical protein n=1 Tax=Sphingobacterium TaxID=28453 RepID=UPI000B48D88F|nr:MULTISPECIES: hypothetical protein [Sphingobacterium]HAL54345.1 hypothetical protein [Sphingobacterium sp.]